MFERLKSFLRDLPGLRDEAAAPSADDPRVAAAALMFHVIDADGERRAGERERLQAVLGETYGISAAELPAIVAAGEEAENEAIDLFAFTSVLKRHLDEEARLEFVRILWEMVYADGVLNEIEDNLVWRIAELIGVDTRDRVRLRHKVAGETTAPVVPPE